MGEFNVGLAARAVKNFGAAGLRFVRAPLGLAASSLRYSSRGRELLLRASFFASLQDAIEDLDYSVATTARTGGKRDILRQTYRPASILPLINSGKKLGLVFGREDRGLTNDELKLCDLAVTIEASEDYPVFNLSHAVAVLLYYLFTNSQPERRAEKRDLSRLRSVLLDQFDQLMQLSGYPERKREEAWLTLRRIIVRANPEEWELSFMAGTLRYANRALSAEHHPNEGNSG